MAKRAPRPGEGRPTKYTEAIGIEICERLKKGELGIDISELAHMPDWSTIWRWQEKHEEFRNAYTRARELQQHYFADLRLRVAMNRERDQQEHVIEHLGKDGNVTRIEHKPVSDNTSVNRDNLICRELSQTMALLNSMYAPRIRQEHTGENGGAIKYEQVVDRPNRETPEEWQARVQKQLESRARKVVQ